jgi:hypothetical protein
MAKRAIWIVPKNLKKELGYMPKEIIRLAAATFRPVFCFAGYTLVTNYRCNKR